MRCLLATACSALALAGAAHASAVRTVTLAATGDVSLPFWCDWGYDWDERCYRDDGPRLAVGGGEPDKVWRSALRFSIPSALSVVTAELSLWYDGTCIAPRKASRPCDGRAFAFGAHPIYTPSWFAEREVEIGPQAGATELGPFASPRWVVWDVTDLVAEWASAGLPNNGVLLKLADDQEDYSAIGPMFPSSTFPDVSVRPRLTVWYMPG